MISKCNVKVSSVQWCVWRFFFKTMCNKTVIRFGCCDNRNNQGCKCSLADNINHIYCTIAGAAKLTIFSTIMWLLLTILFQFVLPSPQGLVFVHVCGAVFMILLPLNCIRVLLCIRRHNAHLVVAAPSQMTTVFQREKKVAIDMCIITVSLFASISPGLIMMLLQIRYPGIHSILHPWSFTMSSITSSINPIIYFGRNKNMRRALKSIINL